VAGFNPSSQVIKIRIPDEVARHVGLIVEENYRITDLLWKETEVELESLELAIELPPYGAFIYRIN
jgi:hypothetical protein